MAALTEVVKLHRSYMGREGFTIIANCAGGAVKVVAFACLLVCPFLLLIYELIRTEGGISPHSSYRSHSCLPA